ncbi:hypothetical protein D9756_011281 [Leucocoprinus leucothites]|uniref:Uncharacterized protein n=1 Tax=Leucocoprinus leucothites TaxID=201217 RepID=A0A8H5CMI9_9AGAR|nr:hypothetical protein D9756_011281 [Leucoagaricus leucothites]
MNDDMRTLARASKKSEQLIFNRVNHNSTPPMSAMTAVILQDHECRYDHEPRYDSTPTTTTTMPYFDCPPHQASAKRRKDENRYAMTTTAAHPHRRNGYENSDGAKQHSTCKGRPRNGKEEVL